MEQLADRQPEIIWQALPSTYQKDITELTHRGFEDRTLSIAAELVSIRNRRRERE